MVEKLNVILKDLKKHDFALFQSNGLALKQGENFFHSLNVKEIRCAEAKGRTCNHQKIRREVMTEHHSRAYTNSKSTKEEGKKKTTQIQRKERGSELKTTSNEFMESVFEMC